MILSGFIYFNQDLIENLLAVTVFSFDNFSSANTVDISQFNRLVVQTPILDSLFLENPVFGSGYYSTSYIKTGHHLMLDLPLYASFATLGIVGVFIHITKYLILIREFFKINVTNVINTNHFVILLLITAYFITQISFRNFQINLELGFDWWYIEHAFFIGIYYAYLKRLKFRNYEKTSY